VPARWVVEDGAERVSRFDPAGNFVMSFKYGLEPLMHPHGIAVDLESKAYVASTEASIR
jgi:hypothetical protein